jgi:flagellar assembly protein FliH
MIRADARRDGYEAGMNQAKADNDQRIMEEAEIRAHDGLQRLHQAVEHLHRTHESWMQDYAEALSSIAIAAAERVVMHRLDDKKDLLLRWAEQALRSTRCANRLTLAVHPETLAELGGALDQLLAGPDLPEQSHIEPDESVDRNAVIVRQLGGEINAGLAAQLQRLEELLT